MENEHHSMLNQSFLFYFLQIIPHIYMCMSVYVLIVNLFYIYIHIIFLMCGCLSVQSTLRIYYANKFVDCYCLKYMVCSIHRSIYVISHFSPIETNKYSHSIRKSPIVLLTENGFMRRFDGLPLQLISFQFKS